MSIATFLSTHYITRCGGCRACMGVSINSCNLEKVKGFQTHSLLMGLLATCDSSHGPVNIPSTSPCAGCKLSPKPCQVHVMAAASHRGCLLRAHDDSVDGLLPVALPLLCTVENAAIVRRTQSTEACHSEAQMLPVDMMHSRHYGGFTPWQPQQRWINPGH